MLEDEFLDRLADRVIARLLRAIGAPAAENVKQLVTEREA
jgi:hypothetical protein